MTTRKPRTIEIPLMIEEYETAHIFIEKELQNLHVSNELGIETMLLFEALFNNLIEQGFGQDTMLMIEIKKSAIGIVVRIGFEGRSYTPTANNPDELSPEIRILQAYGDKVDYRYSSGYNSIRIIAKRSHNDNLVRCFLGIILAILVYIPIHAYMSIDNQIKIEENIVFPLLQLFVNAMLMIGAPVTLFSLLKNFTDIYIFSERNSSVRKLQIKTLITSIISIILALATGLLISVLLNSHGGYLWGETSSAGISISELLAELVPSSIVEPFETLMPFQIILIALLITYAFCSAGKYFGALKKGIEICYTLFSKMLNIVMLTLPFFCFLAILTPLLTGGFGDLILIFEVVVLIFASLIIMVIFYLVRLLIGGVKIRPFLKKLPHMIRINVSINSAIDAVPFNIRYCTRNYGYNRKRISEKLPILAQTSLDGNCFLLMMLMTVFVFMLGQSQSMGWFHIIAIAILVLFLSFGAPNQPGSILIGSLILMFYMKSYDLISIAIYMEVFLGVIQNMINVIGDIVTLAIEEQKHMSA